MHTLKGRIVIVDDDREMRSLLQDFLVNEGYRVSTFSMPPDVLRELDVGGSLAPGHDDGDVDLILSDIRMPKIDGLDFTSLVQKLRPDIPVILMTAFGSIETALESMKRGAFHYIVKPFRLSEVAVNIERALEHRRLQRENATLREEMNRSWSYAGIIGKSAGMATVFELVQRVASATANVLITGETGTGKEMVARAIHQSGTRSTQPFVAINCSAIPDALLESELFGHAKGAFTGAFHRKRGLFEEAEGGTLFLDEIGDMNPALQAKLLRVLQERKIRAVGDTIDQEIHVRVIAATHKDLKTAIREGHFREDLYYRLSVIPILIPPLRHRAQDIPYLAEHFLRKYAALNHSAVKNFTKRAMAKLMSMRWPGNVRELENIVERAVVLSGGPSITDTDLPSAEESNPETFYGAATADFPTLQQLEKRYIQLVVEKSGGRKDRAAQTLGMSRRTLYRKEREYGLTDEVLSDEALGCVKDEPSDERRED